MNHSYNHNMQLLQEMQRTGQSCQISITTIVTEFEHMLDERKYAQGSVDTEL